jgi:hypothetical protein
MYKEDREKYWTARAPSGGNSYGRGMTLSGRLDEAPVDRENIKQKILDRYFDYIIYGSVTRCRDYWSEVIASYPKSRVILIDGEDGTGVSHQYLPHGIMFKREMVIDETHDIHPINFCIPEELMVSSMPEKTQDWGTVIPGKMDTYIFFDEKSYHLDYQRSWFAVTNKKAGWDCLRHYEILMCGCVPYFPDLGGCPKNTMYLFPKEQILNSNVYVSSANVTLDWYKETVSNLLLYTKNNLTTKAMFNKVMEKVSA